MKLKIFILSLIAYFWVVNLDAQGFDWQYSLRQPYQPANLFIGVKGVYGSYFHYGSFGFIEKQIECCNFNNGLGNVLHIGVNSQYWWNGNNALDISISYHSQNASFKSRSVYPRVEYDLITEYNYQTNISYLNLEALNKFRLPFKRSFVSAGLEMSVFLNQSNTFAEHKISPAEDPFPAKRDIPAGSVPDLNRVYISPIIKIGYDLDLGREKYASPELIFTIPIMNRTATERWKTWLIAGGISINWGIGNR